MERTIYAPRPFTRTPRSYRSLTHVDPNSSIKSFGSLNALPNFEKDDDRNSLASSAQSELLRTDLNDLRSFFRPSGTFILNSLRESAEDSRRFGQPQTGTASVSSVDQFSVDSQLSSRASSPPNMNRYPPPIGRPQYIHQPNYANGIHSPGYQLEHGNGTFFDEPVYNNRPIVHYGDPPPRSFKEDDFLQKLKQQRLQVETLNNRYDDRAQYNHGANNNPYPNNVQTVAEDFDPWEHKSANLDSTFSSQFENDSTLDRAYNRALHKTKSDSHVLHEPNGFRNSFQQNTWNNHYNGQQPNAFYSPQPGQHENFPQDSPNFAQQNDRFSAPQQQRVIPIQIADNSARDFQYSSPQSTFEDHRSWGPPRENPMFRSMPQLYHTQRAMPERNAFSPPPRAPQPQIARPYPIQNIPSQLYTPLRPPPIPPPPVNYIGPLGPSAGPVHKSQSFQEHALNQQFSPTREHPLIPRHVHEEILNAIPNKPIRHPPAIAKSLQPAPVVSHPSIVRQPQPPPDDPIPHSPIGSQYYGAPTSPSRNSAIQLGSATEIGYVNHNNENVMSASYPAPNGNLNRSFAIVSRPISPQATIVQPVQPQLQKAVVEQIPMKQPVTIANVLPDSESNFQVQALPIQHYKNEVNGNYQQPQASPISTVEGGVPSPAQMSASPIGSVYDNQTDEEQQAIRSPIRVIPRQRLFSPPPPSSSANSTLTRPPSILIKEKERAEVARAQKKVAFNMLDSEDDAKNKKPLGWADLGLSIYDCCTPCVGTSLEGNAVSAAAGEAPAHIREYDNNLEQPLASFLQLSEKIGGDCLEAAKQFVSIFELQRAFLWNAAGRAEPDQATFQNMLKPIMDKMQALNQLKDSKRKEEHFNHISAQAEAIQAIGWVAQKPTPAPFVKDMLEAAKFFTNRVRKDYKDKAPLHVDWVVALEEIITNLYNFVRKVHTTGLIWNSAPGSVAPTSSGAPSAGGPPPPSGPPPPPPPPIPADLFAPAPAAKSGDDAKRDALFAELNQGEAITGKLKKVTADMQTHKNPNLRAANVVPAGSATSGSASPTKAPAAVQKPPKLEFADGKQWNVEYFKGDPNITVNVTDKKHTVYIFKCEGCTVRINGKCNSVTLDQCKKTAVAFDGIVAQVETINCQSIQLQTLGELPTVSIQKTDGCQIYLSEASVGAEIVTSKSSEMNVLVPGGPDGDFIELPIPEQFKTVFKNGKLETTVSDIC
ncbi:unnamed protein product, partial [Mesorhabditis belari]|uniref:C-CAP/cofactor C-like domain-containing protein n=1 Tax=Mesorhabditis belari TaxID=2138241 RepID=A0AAF3JAX6_9BILA